MTARPPGGCAMTFTTLTFILFLALVFTFYWSLRRRSHQNLLLLIASYGFYAWWDVRFCGLMLATSLLDFVAAIGIDRSPGSRGRKAWLVLSLVCALGTLAFFKYFNFFAASFVELAGRFGWAVDPVTLNVVLPAGISFYTFQTMSYTIDVYRGVMPATTKLIDYLAYVSFFPQLVAGPIERAKDLLPQFFVERRFDEGAASDGCRQILWGFFKKLVIADRLGAVAEMVFGTDPDQIGIAAATGPQIALATVAFAFQIYCDFSAYSDIAIGTAKLFGFRLSRNFAYPYFSRTVGEFWRRWHISLSTWFRDYVFIPLGGSRGGRLRTARNIVITFGLSGLWHGASWTFIVWGLLMGAMLLPGALQRQPARTMPHETPGGERNLPGLRDALAVLRTFLLINLGWLFFRSASIEEAWSAVVKIVTDIANPGAYAALGELITEREGYWALILIPLLVSIEWFRRRAPHPLAMGDQPEWLAPRGTPQWLRWTAYTLIFWFTLYASPRTVAPFIYFQF